MELPKLAVCLLLDHRVDLLRVIERLAEDDSDVLWRIGVVLFIPREGCEKGVVPFHRTITAEVIGGKSKLVPIPDVLRRESLHNGAILCETDRFFFCP